MALLVPLPALSTPHFRTPKACESCRRRKTKCDGRTPQCSLCAQRGLTCLYRERTRIRKSKKEYAAAASGASPNDLPDRSPSTLNRDVYFSDNHGDRDEEGEESQEEAHSAVYSSVSATQTAPTAAAEIVIEVHHYYGPSSNFSFLQQIHQRFEKLARDKQLGFQQGRHVHESAEHNGNRDASPPAPTIAPVESGESSLRRFNYFGLFFGRSTCPTVSARMSHHPPIFHIQRNGFGALGGRETLYMDSFLATSHHLLPFLPASNFQSLLASFSKIHCITKCLVLAALALGATVTKNTEHAEGLCEEARQAMSRFEDMVNLRAIQIDVLVAYYLVTTGRPNASYLVIGKAMRRAFAGGFGKEGVAISNLNDERLKERRLTWASAVMMERIISYAFGRPSAFPVSAYISSSPSISHFPGFVPLPAGYPMLDTIARLSSIMSRAIAEIYRGQSKSLLKTYKAAIEIQTELDNLKSSIEPALHISPRTTVAEGSDGVRQIMIYNLVQHAYMLTFRPFLLFRAMLNPTSPISSHKLHKLNHACRICVDTAREFVVVMDNACKNNSLIRALGFNGFYLETASFIIVYAATLNEATLPPSQELVKTLDTSVECLKVLEAGFPLKTATEAVGRMRGLVEQLCNQQPDPEQLHRFLREEQLLHQRQYTLAQHPLHAQMSHEEQQTQAQHRSRTHPQRPILSSVLHHSQDQGSLPTLPVTAQVAQNPDYTLPFDPGATFSAVSVNNLDPALASLDDPFSLSDPSAATTWDGVDMNMNVDWGFEMGREAFDQFLMMDMDTEGSVSGASGVMDMGIGLGMDGVRDSGTGGRETDGIGGDGMGIQGLAI